MPDKEFKTLDEQIAILRSRGLTIPDEQAAKKFLLYNNYYRVSGYSLTLRDHDVFYPNASFQNIVDIYNFDHELRHVLLEHIETIEVTVKSIYAYEFTKLHGATGYLDSNFFSDGIKHKEIMDKAKKQRDSRLPHEAYLKHFVVDLNQDIPLWAFVDLLTIADISFLYKISEQEIKDAVATSIGLKTRGAEVLERCMHSMTIIRNLCAHGNRLYNRLFQQKPWLSRKEYKLLRVGEDGNGDNAHLFGFVLIICRLLPQDEFLEFKADLSSLFQKFPFVGTKYYGFPDNWESLL